MMKGIAGPAMMLVMVLGFFAYRMFSEEKAPPLSFLELELAGADAPRTGSCYASSTVLVANGWFGNAPRSWVSPRKGAWTFIIEDIQQGPAGPVHRFQKFTFEKFDETVRLVDVEASKDIETSVSKNIDKLLENPNDRQSTPVDRCRENGGSGYRFKAKH
jgi:hypothetical protein